SDANGVGCQWRATPSRRWDRRWTRRTTDAAMLRQRPLAVARALALGGDAMRVRAAICWEPRRALEVDEIDLEGPRAGECLVRLVATGVCHTDAYTMSGRDPSGLFPAVLGHEGGGVVEEVGA